MEKGVNSAMKAIKIMLPERHPRYFWFSLALLAIAIAAGSLATYAIALGRRAEARRPTANGGDGAVSAVVSSLSASAGAGTAVPRPTNAGRAGQGTQVNKQGLHVVAFTFYDNGVEPDVIHTTKGLVAVLLEDRSGGTKGLVLERETGSVRVGVGQVNRPDVSSPTQWRGRSEFNLSPGTYRVTDSSRPLNFAELIVDP
jgi:hypothetical protein